MKSIIQIKDKKLFKRLVDLQIAGNNPECTILLSAIRKVKELDLSKAGIESTDDLRHFSNLKRLNLSNNLLKEINLSKNSELLYLDVSHNKIESFSFKGLKILIYLNISRNRIERFIIAKENKLQELYISKNQLIDLEIYHCKYLRVLDVSNNKLTHLDLSGLSLIFLQAEKNKITSLDLSKQNKVEYVNGSGNKIKECRFQQTKSLRYFTLNKNPIKKHSQKPGLKNIGVYFSMLNSPSVKTYEFYFLQYVNTLSSNFIECQKSNPDRYCFDQMLEDLFELLHKYDKCKSFHKYEKGLIILNFQLLAFLQPAFYYTSFGDIVFKESDFDYSAKQRTYFEDASSLNLKALPDVIQLIILSKNHYFEIDEIAISRNFISNDLVYARYVEIYEKNKKAKRNIIVRNT